MSAAPQTKKPVKKSGLSSSTLTWGSIALVVVIVAVLVVVKVATNSSTKVGQQNDAIFSYASSSVLSTLSSIPASTFDTIGTSASVAVTPPQVFTNKGSLRFTDGTTTKPGVYYFGADFCPYCAATRWSLIIALDRFGKFTGLGNMSSYYADTAGPNTATFTFEKATYTSPYIVFHSTEAYTNSIPSGASYYQTLQTPTKEEMAVLKLFSAQSFPFISEGNQVVTLSAPFDPKLLAGETREQIAKNLGDPLNSATQAIITTANFYTAGICHIDGNAPATVCNSAGVLAAKSALNLK
jgi:thiol-disulfide isomerase/thioredoxin